MYTEPSVMQYVLIAYMPTNPDLLIKHFYFDSKLKYFTKDLSTMLSITNATVTVLLLHSTKLM